ncbi:hypothetical protein L6452_21091 [Arctium lappa]|uniref:Uncharacterized protein n=1 Tax=Arctium lappa TaxID=4217 RepID=A0ACB9BDM3_ARCLA|nr:hypothetical protein L6452_21091 [Arctium lappa]
MDPESLSRSTTPNVSPKHRNTALSPIRDEISTKSESNSRSSDAISSPASDSTQESIIGLTNSLTLDHACLFAGDASGELMNSGDLMSFRAHSSPMGGESDVDSLKVETPSNLDVPKCSLDEPQKVVRWKTQVEHHADEVSFQGHQWQPSPLPNLKSNELDNQAAGKPNPEASAPTSAAVPKKPDVKVPKLASKHGCSFRPRFACSRSWSCTCHCR